MTHCRGCGGWTTPGPPPDVEKGPPEETPPKYGHILGCGNKGHAHKDNANERDGHKGNNPMDDDAVLKKCREAVKKLPQAKKVSELTGEDLAKALGAVLP